jgi:hypothetical protein
MPNLFSDENEAREAYEASFAARESVNTSLEFLEARAWGHPRRVVHLDLLTRIEVLAAPKTDADCWMAMPVLEQIAFHNVYLPVSLTWVGRPTHQSFHRW